ncbi:hypothetical protein PP589_gp21 [Pseudoalteromonas phage HS5]|uniref:hypothetical protein n=1 Tax=Pseudoalteromonas phage H105/1 TaxID=877240 RepID=UPI0001E439D0|nr:hypothetical protein AV949_gp13 [Pseudoalteromonas phage H105/1]YP_010660105.1 hypothetical protein PP589_gp21 [Pseudoalteromonas phage HS5]ADM26673.1 conserved hypothetical protein [Pseudoalteromonas phage H105/1]
MKTLILATTLTVLSFTANAEVNKEEKATCKDMSELAGRYMTLRQSGAPMADIYSTAGDSKIIELMIIKAYEVTRFNTKEFRDRQVIKFKNDWFLACIKNK